MICNPWNRFVSDWKKQNKPKKSFSELAVLYREVKADYPSIPCNKINPWNKFVSDWYKAGKPKTSFTELSRLYHDEKNKPRSAKSVKSVNSVHSDKSVHSVKSVHSDKSVKHLEKQPSPIAPEKPSVNSIDSVKHSEERPSPKKPDLYIISIDSNCDDCRSTSPEVFTQEFSCNLDVSDKNPLVRYSLYGKEYCALASNLLTYFNTHIIVDSVGIETRRGTITKPIGRKRGPVEPYSKLSFSPSDYAWIKSKIKLPRRKK